MLCCETPPSLIARVNAQVPLPIWEMGAHEQAITSIAVCASSAVTRVLTAGESEAKVRDAPDL